MRLTPAASACGITPTLHATEIITIVLGAISAATWLYLLTARGGFWRLPTAAPAQTTASGTVAAVVPARNEADVVGHAITSLLKQTYPDTMHVFLVDDGSSDGTADVARAAAAQAGKPAALSVIRGAPLPPGWSGKLWAVRQGIERAQTLAPRFLLLTDADIVHGPDTVGTLAAIAEQDASDLVSFMVRLRCETFAEKLLIPAFVYFFCMLYPPAWISDARHRTAGAAGGCILIRPEALAGAGGLEAIRGDVIDDCALARAVKRSGGRVWLGLSDASVSVRSYNSFAEIGRMVSRSAFRQLNHSLLLLAGTAAGMAITYLAPVAMLFSRSALAVALGAAAWAMMAASYFPMVRYYRRHPAWALTLPAAAVFYMGATVHSALKYWLGRGGEWKGRVQDSRRATAAPKAG